MTDQELIATIAHRAAEARHAAMCAEQKHNMEKFTCAVRGDVSALELTIKKYRQGFWERTAKAAGEAMNIDSIALSEVVKDRSHYEGSSGCGWTVVVRDSSRYGILNCDEVGDWTSEEDLRASTIWC